MMTAMDIREFIKIEQIRLIRQHRVPRLASVLRAHSVAHINYCNVLKCRNMLNIRMKKDFYNP